jgi:hypothetical protein
MKPWKIVTIVVVGITLAVFVLIAIGGMGVKKKSNNSNQQTTQVSQKHKEKVQSTESPNTQSQSVTEATTRASSQVQTTSEEPKKNESETYALANVNFPDFKTTGSSRAVVSGKKVYKLGSSYVFNIILTVPTETNGNVEVEYLTTFNNYNSVKIGSLLAVEYGISAEGVIAITSAKPI